MFPPLFPANRLLKPLPAAAAILLRLLFFHLPAAAADPAAATDALLRAALFDDPAAVLRQADALPAPPPPLLHKWLFLAASVRPGAPAARVAERRLEGENLDPALRKRLRYAQFTDPAREEERLHGEDRFNRFALLFNGLEGVTLAAITVNLPQLVRQSADLFFLWTPLRALSPLERRRLALLQLHPDLPDAPDALALQTRLRGLQRGEDRAQARWHERNGRWEAAREAWDRLLQEAPGDSAAARARLRTARFASQEDRWRQRNIEFQPRSPAAPLPAERNALLALCLAPDTQLPALLRRIAPPGTPHANAFRESPWTNPLAALENADRARRRDLRFYIFAGDPHDTASLPAVSAGDWFEGFTRSAGILLPFEWILRGAAVVWGHPVPDDAWRDAAVRALGSGPRAPLPAGDAPSTASPVPRTAALRLAGSYEHLQRYDDARTWNTRANGAEDPALTARLDRLAARDLLDLADRAGEPARRSELLARAARFPRTPSGKKARARLDEMEKGKTDLVQVPRADLVEWPNLAGPRAFQIDPAWLDGNPANGELRKDGLHFRAPDGAVLEFTLDTPAGPQSRKITADAPAKARWDAALHEWETETRARQRLRDALERPRIPFQLEGSAGLEGMDLLPRLLQKSLDPETRPLYESVSDERR